MLQSSQQLPERTPVVQGYDFNLGVNYEKLLQSYKHAGFQATNFGRAVDEINRMLEARDVPLTNDELDQYEEDELIKPFCAKRQLLSLRELGDAVAG